MPILALKHLYASVLLKEPKWTLSRYTVYYIVHFKCTLCIWKIRTLVLITHLAHICPHPLQKVVHFLLKFPFLKKCLCMPMIINVIFRTRGTCNLHTKLNVSDNWEILHRKTPWRPFETDRSILSGFLQWYLHFRQHTSKCMWHTVWGETP